MASYDEYREKALECIAATEHATDPQERLGLLEIAQSWMKLAKYVAARESPGSNGENED